MKWKVRGVASEHDAIAETTSEGLAVTIDGVRRLVDYTPLNESVASLRFLDNGHSFHVTAHTEARRQYRMAVADREYEWRVLTPVESVVSESAGADVGSSRIQAPIPGKVVAVHVAVGDEVEAGQSLVVLDAMKMENELAAERSGTVATVHVAPGDTVDSGTVLVDLEKL